jgi:hypothetical protein
VLKRHATLVGAHGDLLGEAGALSARVYAARAELARAQKVHETQALTGANEIARLNERLAAARAAVARHAAGANAGRGDRVALAITYFIEGTIIDDVLEMLPSGAGDARGGVRFAGERGDLVVHVLADDVDTWQPWLARRPSALVPGAPMRDDALTPLVYEAGGRGEL